MIGKFSPQDLNEAKSLLTNLYREVSSEESKLSGGTKLGIGGNALQSLYRTKVKFGNPTSELIKLDKKLFNKIGIELTEIRKRQMGEQFNFYYMTLTVSLQPKRGSQFIRVECALSFGPKGMNEPIVQDIFPDSDWKEIISWGGGINLALNSNLEWAAGVKTDYLAKLVNLPADVKANITSENKLKAFIVIPDYSFKLGHPEIVATGKGNSECLWRIENPDLKKTQTVQFGIVFRVPKDINSIELTGIVVAEPSMNWLVANLREVFTELSGKLQRILLIKDDERSASERLPIGDHEKWYIKLPN